MKATSVLMGIPRKPSRNAHPTETIIAKMIDLEDEINNDIDALVDLKTEIVRLIKKVEDSELQTVLELRYLCFKTWKQISDEMGYSEQHIYRLHGRALDLIQIGEYM
jgi:DNA-directed RNA polymerase specialized sigma subunit